MFASQVKEVSAENDNKARKAGSKRGMNKFREKKK